MSIARIVPLLICGGVLHSANGQEPAAAAPTATNATNATNAPRAAKVELKLLFVGANETAATGAAATRAARTRDYVEFLKSEFTSVRAADRDHFDRKLVGDADVVLLDWSQAEVDLDHFATLASPIGPRDEWKTPTVLLGSAGLLLGVPWQLKGGFG
jgi:hypothetical protein